MKITAITQARISSSRLPKKVLKEIDSTSLLEIHLKRISKSKVLTHKIVATTNEPGTEIIEDLARKNGFEVFKGSVDNVLERFYLACKNSKPNYIVRLTSDCPLIDADLIDELIQKMLILKIDYLSNTLRPTFPDGQDIEIFTFETLQKAYSNSTLKSELEHVTPYIWKNSTEKGGKLFRSFSFENDKDFSDIRLTVDEELDFELIHHLVTNLGSDKSWMEYVNYLIQNPELKQINSKYKRNEGFQKSVEKDRRI